MFNPPSMRSACIILLFLVAFVSQAQAEAVKPAIAESEFLRLVNEDKDITGRTVKAELLVKALSLGNGVTAKECSIEGDLVFRNKEASSLNIIDTVVNGKIKFDGTTFKEQLTFSGKTAFNDEVTFDNVTFNDLFTIDGEVVFNKWFHAYSCKFSEQVRLDNVSFKNGASFNASTFNKLASFIATKTSGRGMYFEKASFLGPAELDDMFIYGEAEFSEAKFKDIADFSYSEFLGEEVNFLDVEFSGTATFSHTKMIGTVTFADVKFLGDAHFDQINSGSGPFNVLMLGDALIRGKLVLASTSFHGRAYFDESLLYFFTLSNHGGKERNRNPTIFEKRLIAPNLVCKVCDFTEVEFRDYVDFSNAWFTETVVFSGASFDGEVDFYGARFPPLTSVNNKMSGGISFDKVRFEKTVHLDYSQLRETSPWWRVWANPKTKVSNLDTTTWGALERAFKNSGSTDSQNEAFFNKRSLAPYSDGPDRENRAANFFEKRFWGYGVRPWRLFFWILILLGGFTAIYFSQTKPLGSIMERLRFALDFTWRTSVTIGYGYQQSRTTLFKTLTLIHSVVFKIMVLCLLKAVANVSPLLNDLIGKLLPM